MIPKPNTRSNTTTARDLKTRPQAGLPPDNDTGDAADWDTADKGRRLDHIWATRDIAGAAHSSRVLRHVRGWTQPSDHAPVLATFDL